MKIPEHLTKAEAFERALAKLDPVEDGELYIVLLMRAGTNRVNAALHALGITVDTAAPPPNTVGDLNHTYKPRLAVDLPEQIRLIFKRLSFIEDLRSDYVRGARVVDHDLAAACDTAYAYIRSETQRILAGIHA
jgi:hypothetical protein